MLTRPGAWGRPSADSMENGRFRKAGGRPEIAVPGAAATAAIIRGCPPWTGFRPPGAGAGGAAGVVYSVFRIKIFKDTVKS